MPTPILDIFRQSGEDHLGQTLVRLARLAEAAHQREVAAREIEACLARTGLAGRPNEQLAVSRSRKRLGEGER